MGVHKKKSMCAILYLFAHVHVCIALCVSDASYFFLYRPVGKCTCAEKKALLSVIS